MSRLQSTYNVLYSRIAMDEAFLDEIMGEGGVASVDDFTGELWRRWKQLRVEGIVQVRRYCSSRDLVHSPSRSV